MGSNGCGKTHLAMAIVHERLAAGERVVFLTVPDQPDHLRASGRWSCRCSMIWGRSIGRPGPIRSCSNCSITATTRCCRR
ncbi:ATP-binding protein [Thermosporothrix hazakensis]|uniref:ATP-binding protein n=1 Tax=Thermosporothrix hazakensis TaxID=644383 RepID=UPI003531144C